jgi:hypothetical protein
MEFPQQLQYVKRERESWEVGGATVNSGNETRNEKLLLCKVSVVFKIGVASHNTAPLPPQRSRK